MARPDLPGEVDAAHAGIATSKETQALIELRHGTAVMPFL